MLRLLDGTVQAGDGRGIGDDEQGFKFSLILTASTEDNRDPRTYELQEIGKLVLKLYASNIDDPHHQTRALNLFDRLVERGLIGVQKLEAA